MQKGETYKIESLKGKWKNNCHALNRKVDCTQTEETGEYLDCQAEAHEWINSSLTDMNYWLLHKNTHLYTSTPEMFRVRCEESRKILFSKEYPMVKYSFGENIYRSTAWQGHPTISTNFKLMSGFLHFVSCWFLGLYLNQW